MTTNYTDSEIQTVVDSLVLSSIRRPYDTLGVRRTDITFSDVQESVAGVFLMYPRSTLYVLGLAGQQVTEVYQSFVAASTDIQDALRILRRRSLPVKDVSSLSNASAALLELEGLVAQSAPKDITQVPAYKRMNSNLDRFLAAAGSNIKNNGSIVQTPEEARSSLNGLVNSLETQTVEYLRRVALLSDGLSNYNSMNLAQLLSSTVIQNARAMLDARVATLNALTPEARLQVLRETVLEVLGIKATVKTFGSFPGVSSSNSLTGFMSAYSDSSRGGVPAAVSMTTLTGGLAMVADTGTNILQVWVDGALVLGPPSQEFYLPGSQYPYIELGVAGPYTITSNTLDFLIDNTTTVPVTFTTGVRTAAQVATELDGALSGDGFTAETFFLPIMYEGEVVTDAANKVSLAFGDFPSSSITPGDEVDFYLGPNAVQTRTVVSIHTVPGGIDYFYVGGAALVASSVNRMRSGNQRSVRILPMDKKASILGRRRIQVKLPTTVEQQTALSLGIYGEVYGQGQATDASFIASFVTKSSTVCSGSSSQDIVYTGDITTDPNDSTLITLTSAVGVIDMSVIISSGPNAGTYYIASDEGGGKYKLRSPLPQYVSGFGQPVVLTGTVGFEQYAISSKNTTLSSTVAMKGPTNLGLLSGLLGPNMGTSFYVKFSSGYKDVLEGDVLELYLTSTVTPDYRLTVLQVYSDGVLRLDAAIPMNLNISVDSQTLPFVRLVTGHVVSFETMATTLVALLQQSDANPTAYFKDLNRFINPLIVNTNPTDSEIGSAETRVNDLTTLLAQMNTAIVAYNPSVVPQVDDMVKTLKEKGVDRGLDLLLSAEFDIFFGLTQEETSYAGAFQKAVRDVARMDLVIRKQDRAAVRISPLKSSASSPDMEHSFIDRDTAPRVDPPVDIDYSGD